MLPHSSIPFQFVIFKVYLFWKSCFEVHGIQCPQHCFLHAFSAVYLHSHYKPEYGYVHASTSMHTVVSIALKWTNC